MSDIAVPAKPAVEFFDISLSGAIVDRLREGNAQAVRRLALFGARPGMTLPHDPSGAGAPQTRTLWNWSHWAPVPDAVEAWGPYIDGECETLRDAARRWQDAVEGSTHSATSAPLSASWKIVEQVGARCGYARHSMVASLMQQAMAAPEASAAGVLRALAVAGTLVPSDVVDPAIRQRWPVNPLFAIAAAPSGRDELLEVVLGMFRPSGEELDGMCHRLHPLLSSATGASHADCVQVATRIAPLLEPQHRAILLHALEQAETSPGAQALRILLGDAPATRPRRRRA